MRLQDVPVEALHERFVCDPTTGVLTRARASAHGPLGSVTGAPDADGRVRVYLHGMAVRRAQIVWAMHYGAWPAPGLVVDHINGDCSDDRIVNLRCITQRENSQNRKVQKNSTTGIPGVYLVPSTGRFRVRVKHQGKLYYGGMFMRIRDAAEAAARLRLEVHPYARSEHLLPELTDAALAEWDARAEQYRAQAGNAKATCAN